MVKIELDDKIIQLAAKYEKPVTPFFLVAAQLKNLYGIPYESVLQNMVDTYQGEPLTLYFKQSELYQDILTPSGHTLVSELKLQETEHYRANHLIWEQKNRKEQGK